MNENCLEGMRCPRCGSYGPFRIGVRMTLLVHDDGTEVQSTDVEWDEESFCACTECSMRGIVRDFYEEDEEND